MACAKADADGECIDDREEDGCGEDEEEEEEEGEEEGEEEDEEEEDEAAMKKPAAAKAVLRKPSVAKIITATKKPAAAEPTKKRPAAALAAVVGAGAEVPPEPSFKPTDYKGGKIYFSKAKHAWRVYVRKRDRIEAQVKVNEEDDDEVNKRWKKCLKLIRHDKRPIES